MAKRYFEFKDAKSQKFWQISQRGNKYTVQFGSIGSYGQKKVKELGSSSDAKAAAEKLVNQKLRKGYAEVESASGLYDDVIEFLARVEDPKKKKMNSRNRFTPAQINKLVAEFPKVPQDFLAYLREVGWGSFRQCQFMVYGFLATPNELYGKGVFPRVDARKRVLCFGDNFSGDPSGFRPGNHWDIVELGHDNGETDWKSNSFGQYIRQQMFMGPNGEDLQASIWLESTRP